MFVYWLGQNYVDEELTRVDEQAEKCEMFSMCNVLIKAFYSSHDTGLGQKHGKTNGQTFLGYGEAVLGRLQNVGRTVRGSFRDASTSMKKAEQQLPN